MAIQKFKVYMTVGTGKWNHGQVDLQTYEPNDKPDDSFGRRLLKVIEVELDVPEFDLHLMEIDALERCVISERADSQVRVNMLIERISKLKAITHESGEE